MDTTSILPDKNIDHLSSFFFGFFFGFKHPGLSNDTGFNITFERLETYRV